MSVMEMSHRSPDYEAIIHDAEAMLRELMDIPDNCTAVGVPARIARRNGLKVPDLDQILEIKKGICFDYAAMMTAMLRSQEVPCKLVVGYAGVAYHAWISVYKEKDGWIDNVIYFDGTTWKRMDPTFASSANKSEAIMKYIGDGSNYTEKYIY